MAEEVQNTGDSKLLVEEDESEGPILKFSLGEMIWLFRFTEIVQSLCLMCRPHHAKGPFFGWEKKAFRDFCNSQIHRQTKNLDEYFRFSAEEDNWSQLKTGKCLL